MKNLYKDQIINKDLKKKIDGQASLKRDPPLTSTTAKLLKRRRKNKKQKHVTCDM